MMQKTQLIRMLLDDVMANGDGNIALGVIAQNGNAAYRLDAHGEMSFVQDTTVADGMTYLVADGVDPASVTSLTSSGLTRAKRFMQELLDSVETLSGIAEQHGPRTLADLMFLHSAIVQGGFIDCYPDESAVLTIASSLPSGTLWSQYIELEYMASANDRDVRAPYAGRFEQFKFAHAELLTKLEAMVAPCPAAISSLVNEQWIADSVREPSLIDRLASVLWLYGVDFGTHSIRTAMAKAA